MSSKMVMNDKVKDLQYLDPPGPAVQQWKVGADKKEENRLLGFERYMVQK
jgi:hypothetical protein